MSSFCQGCGNSMADGERFCAVCGHDAQAGPAVRVDPAVQWGLLPETSKKAIFSLICGLFFIVLPVSFLGLIFGYIALSEIRKTPERLTGRGFAITGIVLSYIGVALTVFVIGVGIVGVYRIRETSKDPKSKHTAATLAPKKDSIVTAVRTLNTAEIAYSQRHPGSGYTCSLAELSSAWQIENELHEGERKGYTFKLNCPTVKTGDRVATYQLLAYPAPKMKIPEAPIYCSNESAVIRISHSGSPLDCLTYGTDLLEKENSHPPVVMKNSPQ